MSSAPTNEFPFIMTTTPNTERFSFNISAVGNFIIDWGDGNIEKIDKNKTGEQIISHSYNNAGAHKIKLGGKATGYDIRYAAISFCENLNLAKIDGSLGQIFSTLSDGTQPRFGSIWNWCGTFQGCTNLTGEIPAELFSGISGAPASSMFSKTFSGCSGLTCSIPENLFAGIKGAPASSMFFGTFDGCSGVTGSIPENLFAGIKGAPAELMFCNTFSGCSRLSGNIPENLFAGISGTQAYAMFNDTFYGCSGLTGSIPENLFAGITGAPAEDMFAYTFEDCSNLSGSIPENLFAWTKGAPAYAMFDGTFRGCSGLSGTMDELGNIKNKKAPSAVTATKKEQNVQTRKKRRKRHKRSRDVKPQQNSCENLIQEPKFTPMPDMGMTGTISVDIKISGITPDDLAKIIQMACSACNKPNIQITSDIAKHVQQNNLNQR